MAPFVALHLRRYRQHPGRAVLSVLGIAAGSMLVVSLLGLSGSVTGSARRLADLAGRADVEVSGATDAGIPAGLVDELAAMPGVESAVPAVRAPVIIGRSRVLLVGFDGRAAALGDGGGGGPAACGLAPGVAADLPAGVVLGPGVAATLPGVGPGDLVGVYGTTGVAEAPVLAVLDCRAARDLNAGWFVAAPLPVAQQLSGRPDRVDSVYLVAATGVDAADLQRRAAAVVGPRAVVGSPELRVRQAAEAMRPFEQASLVLVSLALVVAGFLVFNTMSMAALERRRELATLRALGGPRRRLLAGFLAEAALLGLAGSLLGAVAGVALGRRILEGLPLAITDFIGVMPRFSLPPAAIPLGVAVGVVATLVASAGPARSAVSVPPVDAMRPEGVLESSRPADTVRWAVATGLVVLVAGTATSVLAEGGTALVGFGGTTLGVLLATFGLTGPLARLTGAVAGRFGAAGRLAAASLERAPRRVWVTTMAVTVAVGLVIGIGGVVRNQTDSFAAMFRPLGDTDLWLAATPAATLPAEVRLPLPWKEELAAVPGVASVVAGQAAFVSDGADRLLVEGVDDAASNIPVMGLADAAARGAVAAGTGAVVTRALAERLGLARGDDLVLPTPTGEQRTPVAGIVELVDITQNGLAVVSLDQLTAWFGRPGANWFEVNLAPGADPGPVLARAQELADGVGLPLFPVTGEESLAEARGSIESSLSMFTAMQWVVVGAVALAILNTLLISVVERRRELGIVRAVGTSRRQVRGMVLGEAYAIAAVGAALGVVLGLMQHRVGVEAVRGVTGMVVDHELVGVPVALALAAAALMAAAGAVLPAWRAGAVDVLDAIGYE